MSGGMREIRALLRLRAMARRNVQVESRFLADLERARSDALLSLENLEAVIRTEETVALGRTEVGFRDFAAYLAGAAAKRTALLQSCRILDAEIATKRQAVVESEIDVKKLDHLTSQLEGRLRKTRRKKEDDGLDEAGLRSHAQRRSAG